MPCSALADGCQNCQCKPSAPLSWSLEPRAAACAGGWLRGALHTASSSLPLAFHPFIVLPADVSFLEGCFQSPDGYVPRGQGRADEPPAQPSRSPSACSFARTHSRRIVSPPLSDAHPNQCPAIRQKSHTSMTITDYLSYICTSPEKGSNRFFCIQ